MVPGSVWCRCHLSTPTYCSVISGTNSGDECVCATDGSILCCLFIVHKVSVQQGVEKYWSLLSSSKPKGSSLSWSEWTMWIYVCICYGDRVLFSSKNYSIHNSKNKYEYSLFCSHFISNTFGLNSFSINSWLMVIDIRANGFLILYFNFTFKSKQKITQFSTKEEVSYYIFLSKQLWQYLCCILYLFQCSVITFESSSQFQSYILISVNVSMGQRQATWLLLQNTTFGTIHCYVDMLFWCLAIKCFCDVFLWCTVKTCGGEWCVVVMFSLMWYDVFLCVLLWCVVLLCFVEMWRAVMNDVLLFIVLFVVSCVVAVS